MTKNMPPADPKVIEAEENLLIDFQVAIQEMMSEKNINRSQLAERSGMSNGSARSWVTNPIRP